MTETLGIKTLKTIPPGARLSITLSEAIMLLSHIPLNAEEEIQYARMLAYLFGRDEGDMLAAVKRGAL